MGTMYQKQAKTSFVSPISNDGLTNVISNNASSLSNYLTAEADKIKRQELKQRQLEYSNLLLDATGTLSNTMYDTFNNFSADPVNLEKNFEKNKSDLVEGLPDEIKLDVLKQFLTLKNNYVIKAKENYKNNLDFQSRNSIISFIDSKLGSAQVYYENMFNGTLTDEIKADFQINKQVIDNKLLETGTRGQNFFNSEDIKRINKQFNDIKLTSASNYFSGLFENSANDNYNYFLSVVDTWEHNPKIIQEKYDLSQEDYKKLMSYANTLKRIATSDEKDNIYNIRKTPQQKIVDANVLTELESRYKFFDIKNEKGKIKIKNSDLNNVESLVDFRNKVREARANNHINNEQFKKYITNTNLALNSLIGDNSKLKDGNRWFKTTAGEKINDRIKEFFKSESDVYIDDKVFFYENAFNLASENQINLNASDRGSIEKIDRIMDTLKEQYIKDKFITLKEKTNAVIFGNNVMPYDRKSGTIGNKNLDNGGYVRMKDSQGREAMVLRDKNGKVIDIKKI